MLKPGATRFYKAVSTDPSPDAPGRIRVLLDGRPLRTPMGGTLELPGAALADAVADEWRAQADQIAPASMPMTQLAFTTIDRIGKERPAIAANIAKYAETDLLCHRADAPADLAARQRGAWDPLLDWADETFGARLAVTLGVLPATQPADAVGRLGRAVAALDDFGLAVVAVVVQATGSLVIGLALLDGRLDADAAVAASQVDDAYQVEKWGADKEATDRLDALMREIREAARFLALARAGAA
ncbi:MAG: ATP12 family protein [Rhodospirillaceae bacterium]